MTGEPYLDKFWVDILLDLQKNADDAQEEDIGSQ